MNKKNKNLVISGALLSLAIASVATAVIQTETADTKPETSANIKMPQVLDDATAQEQLNNLPEPIDFPRPSDYSGVIVDNPQDLQYVVAMLDPESATTSNAASGASPGTPETVETPSTSSYSPNWSVHGIGPAPSSSSSNTSVTTSDAGSVSTSTTGGSQYAAGGSGSAHTPGAPATAAETNPAELVATIIDQPDSASSGISALSGGPDNVATTLNMGAGANGTPTVSVPEPGTMGLMGLGALGLTLVTLRRKNRR